MTCIIALKTPTSIIIGSDRATCINDCIEPMNNPKVFKKLKNCYIGVSGSGSVANALEIFELPEWLDGQDAYDYMVRNFVPKLRRMMIDNLMLSNRNGFQEFDGTILVVLDSRIFRITCRFSVMESSSDWMTIGSGSYFALGSLHSTDGFEESFGMTARARVLLALEAAAANDPYVRRPFDIIEVPLCP